jgi:ankyrin repeat protein
VTQRLLKAANQGHVQGVRELLTNGADVNLANNNGATALMIAAESGHKDIVELLLGKGADVNKPTTDGWTALMIAAQNGHKDIVELLVNKVDDVNLANNNGNTALMIAAQSGHKEIMELLLGKGADVNIATNIGITAIMFALGNGHTAVVEKLFRAGAAIDIANRNLVISMVSASSKNYHKTVAFILAEAIKKKLDTVNLPLNGDVCPISHEADSKLSVPVQFQGKTYELKCLLEWVFEKKDSLDLVGSILRQDTNLDPQVEILVPHNNTNVTYPNLYAFFSNTKLVTWTDA